MADTITRASDGVTLTLPPINVVDTQICSHTVSIDGIPMPVNMAVRYLLADRERIKTQLADARSEAP